MATNLLSRSVIRLSQQGFAFLQSLDQEFYVVKIGEEKREILRALREGLFILPDDFDEWEYIKRRHTLDRKSREIFTAVIATTMGCNMNCHYCFESKREQTISEAQHQELVDTVLRFADKYDRLHVQWFGGEPLMAFDTIRDLSSSFVRECRRRGKAYSAEVITNGLTLTGDCAAELANLGVIEAQVTFEGMRRLHDRIRFTTGHMGSFDRLVENVEAASEHLEMTLRIHVTPHSLDSVHELIDYLATHSLQTKIVKLYFAPISNYRSGQVEGAFKHEPRKYLNSREFAAHQNALIDHALQCGFSVPDFLNVSYGICTAVKAGTIVVNPSGSLAKCYLDAGNEQEAVGHLGSGLVHQGNLLRWERYDFSRDAECRRCAFAPVCLGGCPKQEMLDAPKSMICTPLRYNFHDRVRSQYRRAS